MLKASVSSFVATVFSVSAAWATPTQSVTFDFANDPQGWTLEQQTGWVASGGNPGGHLETFTRPFDEDYGNQAHAPASWAGDWRDLEDRATITFDYRLFDPGEAVNDYGRPSLYLSNGTITARWEFGPDITDTTRWFSYSAPITLNSDWTVEGGTWEQLLQNVTDVRIAFTTVSNNWYPQDLNGLDNVGISIVPEPAMLMNCLLVPLVAARRRASRL